MKSTHGFSCGISIQYEGFSSGLILDLRNVTTSHHHLYRTQIQTNSLSNHSLILSKWKEASQFYNFSFLIRPPYTTGALYGKYELIDYTVRQPKILAELQFCSLFFFQHEESKESDIVKSNTLLISICQLVPQWTKSWNP